MARTQKKTKTMAKHPKRKGSSVKKASKKPLSIGRALLFALIFCVLGTIVLSSRAALPGAQSYNNGHGVKRIADDEILFDRWTEGVSGHELFVTNSTGTSLRRLTYEGNQYETWWARMSPDRTKIIANRNPVGTRNAGDDYSTVTFWIMDADGTNQKIIKPQANQDGWFMHGHMMWSPDGSRIVFAGGKNDYGSGRNNIWTMKPDGSDIRRVTSFSNRGWGIDPSWTPDGRIVFMGNTDEAVYNRNHDIISINPDGSDLRKHTNAKTWKFDVMISPDGKYVTWYQTINDLAPIPFGTHSTKIARWNPKGLISEEKFLLNDGQGNSYPMWVPNSTEVLFHRGFVSIGGNVNDSGWRLVKQNVQSGNWAAFSPFPYAHAEHPHWASKFNSASPPATGGGTPVAGGSNSPSGSSSRPNSSRGGSSSGATSGGSTPEASGQTTDPAASTDPGAATTMAASNPADLGKKQADTTKFESEPIKVHIKRVVTAATVSFLVAGLYTAFMLFRPR